jgi:hypothetical protein
MVDSVVDALALDEGDLLLRLACHFRIRAGFISCGRLRFCLCLSPVTFACPSRLSLAPVPRACPSRLSLAPVPRVCPSRLSLAHVPRACPSHMSWRMSLASVPRGYPSRLSRLRRCAEVTVLVRLPTSPRVGGFPSPSRWWIFLTPAK